MIDLGLELTAEDFKSSAVWFMAHLWANTAKMCWMWSEALQGGLIAKNPPPNIGPMVYSEPHINKQGHKVPGHLTRDVN